VNGKVHCANLLIRIEGIRPASIAQEGNKAFERSRGQAQEKFAAMLRDAKAQKQSAEYVQKLHEIRTGQRIDSIPLGQLTAEWQQAPRKRPGSPRYVSESCTLLKRFVDFLGALYQKAETLADVTPEMAEAFMQAERERGVSGRTFNAALILLRSAFKVLARKANLAQNPFASVLTADQNTAHRQPFNQEELRAILTAAEGDPFIRPVIVSGVCTAMRRGDCCMLRWKDVDLKDGFVQVKTAKTGETVEIPLFPLLRDEIEKHRGYGSDFVFPEQADMYQSNRDGITYRVRRVFEAAGFYDGEGEEEETAPTLVREPDARPLLPAAELLERGTKALAKVPDGELDLEKRARMMEAFRLYVGGMPLPAVALEMGISKSSVSVYLSEIEERTGLRLKRGNAEKRDRPKCLGGMTAERNTGLRRASIRGFHSFRVTWITIALTAGVPLEIVQRVTGHKTVDVVLKHYFRPGREDFRRTLENAMPQLFLEAAQPRALPASAVKEAEIVYREPATPAALIRAAIKAVEKQTARNWKGQREEALQALRELAALV
jgi:integrase